MLYIITRDTRNTTRYYILVDPWLIDNIIKGLQVGTTTQGTLNVFSIIDPYGSCMCRNMILGQQFRVGEQHRFIYKISYLKEDKILFSAAHVLTQFYLSNPVTTPDDPCQRIVFSIHNRQRTLQSFWWAPMNSEKVGLLQGAVSDASYDIVKQAFERVKNSITPETTGEGWDTCFKSAIYYKMPVFYDKYQSPIDGLLCSLLDPESTSE